MALDATPLDPASLPAIVAGPILRAVTRARAAVWIALTDGSPVTLHLRPAGQPAGEVAAGTFTPVQVGSRLWLAVVTGDAPGGAFTSGQIYEYRLSSPGWPEPNWLDLAIGTSLPAFPAPPAAVEDLVVLHTSCRKIHGGGLDGLAHARTVIADRMAAGKSRPHLLVGSGDQVYADEVAAPVAPRIRRIAADLVGIDETGVFGPLPPIGGRQASTDGFGLTSSAASDHLWTFGEFLAGYLLSWSDALWPAALPSWGDIGPGDLDPAAGLDEAGWDELRDAAGRYRAVLPDARKVLATVPSLMVLDDHEVTDDWNLGHEWATAVYGNPAGSRLVTNGLLAYALCQHWGNVPEPFATAGNPEAAVLAGAAFTGASPDAPALRARLGVPAPPGPAPAVLRDVADAIAVRYDVAFGPSEGWPVRVVGLDERTQREFPSDDAPAARVSMAALAAMLPTPPAAEDGIPTLVVAPSPVLGTHVIEHVIQPLVSLLPGGSEYADFESWPAVPANHQELLRRLAPYAPLVLLGGDVHYSTTAELNYTRAGTTIRGAGVTSSASKNADAKTMALHLFGDLAMRLGIERSRRFVGFTALSAAQRAQLAGPPPAGTVLPYDDLADVLLGRGLRAALGTPAVLSGEVADAYGLGPPDWEYTVEPVDDETMPPPGELLDALLAAPAPAWSTWDPAKSYLMVKALRANDLHRIGRVFDGLPQVSVLEVVAPTAVRHTLSSPAGDDPGAPVVHRCETAVELA